MTASGSENTYAQLYPYCVSVGTARMSLGKTVRVIWKRHALPFPFAFSVNHYGLSIEASVVGNFRSYRGDLVPSILLEPR